MPSLAKIEIGMRGPVNSDGRDDLRGSDYRITMIFPDDEIVRGALSLEQIKILRDLCDHFISVAGP